MLRAADTARRHGELARIGLGISDELGNRFGRNRWIYYHDEGDADDAGDWRDVTGKIEIEVVVECHVPRVSRSSLQQRVAVWWRAHDRFGAKIAACARPVLDDERLAKALRQPLTHHAGDNVGAAAGRPADDDAHRPRRISLCRCGAR